MNLTPRSNRACARPAAAAQRGTTLIELMIAIAILAIVAGAAFSLFNQQAKSSSTLQGQVGLSLALRNATSQLQLDLANAGDGYFQGVNIPSWPVGVTITNNWVAPGSTCYNSTTGEYGYNCFDQLNIISAANSTTYPPTNATDVTGGTSATSNCSYTFPTGGTGVPGATTTVYAQAAPPNLAHPSGLTLAQTAAEFSIGDQLLFINLSGNQITSAVLAAAPTTNGKAVVLTIYQTQSDGSNIVGSPATDPLNITTCDRTNTTTVCNPSNLNNVNNPFPHSRFGVQYCGSDWIIKLAPITYQVCSGPGSPTSPYACDQSSTSPDIADPKLMRTQVVAGVSTSSVVMEQIIGFKLGAAIWNSVNNDYNSSTSLTYPDYYYNASQYAITNINGTQQSVAFNYTLIRAIRASIIGRTAPNNNSSYTYRNTFDGGPYQVQGTAIVVNPRNMSMNDN
jgi:prepilin-type N-terminal cleavage/methylation domain-containing protein